MTLNAAVGCGDDGDDTAPGTTECVYTSPGCGRRRGGLAVTRPALWPRVTQPDPVPCIRWPRRPPVIRSPHQSSSRRSPVRRHRSTLWVDTSMLTSAASQRRWQEHAP
ncbi:unnamed protein product [Merluccius merluccius]